MHIVFVSRELPPSLRCGGIGTYVWDIATALVTFGHQVTVICASDKTKELKTFKKKGVNIIRLSGGDFAIPGVEKAGNNPFGRNLRSIVRYWSYRKKVADCLDRLIDTEKVDIVEFAEYGNEAAVWMYRQRRIPMVVRLHTPSTLNRKTGKRYLLTPKLFPYYKRALQEYESIKQAQAVTSCSKALADWIKADAGFTNFHIEVLPNPIDFWTWNQPLSDKDKDSNLANNNIFSAGTVVPAKGYKDLMDAVSILRNRGRDVSLTIAGKWGALGRSLEKKKCKDSDMSSCLSLLGVIPREKLREFYQKASIVCFPAWWENFPMVCLEAMSSGAIVVASSSGGMSEIIRDGIDGFLVEPKDSFKIANRLAEVLDISNDQKIMIKNQSQERIRSAFDMNILLPQFIEFYEIIIKNNILMRSVR